MTGPRRHGLEGASLVRGRRSFRDDVFSDWKPVPSWRGPRPFQNKTCLSPVLAMAILFMPDWRDVLPSNRRLRVRSSIVRGPQPLSPPRCSSCGPISFRGCSGSLTTDGRALRRNLPWNNTLRDVAGGWGDHADYAQFASAWGHFRLIAPGSERRCRARRASGILQAAELPWPPSPNAVPPDEAPRIRITAPSNRPAIARGDGDYL